MVQPGRDSPGKEVKDMSSSSPKWVFRPTNAKRKMKKSATPHPVKAGGNTKRTACVPLTETGRVRKKIVFEFEELLAGTIGGSSAIAGNDGASSLPGERERGRWKRKARPGPFEANNGAFEVVPGALPLLAGELRFSMGQKEYPARHQPGVVAGARFEGALPEENDVVAQEELRSTCVGVAANAAVLDEDTSSEQGNAPACDMAGSDCEEVAGSSPAPAGRDNGESRMGLELVKHLVIDGTNPHVKPKGDGVTCLEVAACDSQKKERPKATLHGEGNVGPFLVSDILNSNSTPCDTHPFPLPLDNGELQGARPSGASPPESSPEKLAQPPAGAWKVAKESLSRLGVGSVEGAPATQSFYKAEPISLDATKIKALGTAGCFEGTPSLSFSDLETDYLSEKLGIAVVGKFSHSLPTTYQIQMSLGGLGLVGSFTWKHLNAKHILIQFQEMADYVKVLNGPNGSPTWYVAGHPMRVFKWAPDFDTFFESPIVAVWCNIVGIPAHLYEESALMAIGKLLGKPLQADHATIHQNRLSFARICVEIDISTSPTEEIILNIRGKDSRYKVAWDRIPLFCANCKHVGHEKEDCHAAGRKARGRDKDCRAPSKENLSSRIAKITRREWRPKADAWSGTPSSIVHLEKAKECNNHAENFEGTTGAGSSKTRMASRSHPSVDEDGFQLVSRKMKGKVHEGDMQTKAPHVNDWHLKKNVATVTFGSAPSGSNVSSISPMSVACGPPNREMEGLIEDLDPGEHVPCGGIPIVGLN